MRRPQPGVAVAAARCRGVAHHVARRELASCRSSRAGAACFRTARSPRDGPRARAQVHSVPKRSRGHQGNTPSSIERRKEARKAFRPSGRSQKTPSDVIQVFQCCGTSRGTFFIRYCFYSVNGGEGGIRTPGPSEGTTDFESAPFGHSGTSPDAERTSRAWDDIVGNRRPYGNVQDTDCPDIDMSFVRIKSDVRFRERCRIRDRSSRFG